VLLVHGGAGRLVPGLAEARRLGLSRAALIGSRVLANGGSAVDAVERAVQVLEDDPAFNAGRGAYLNQDGDVELDASIMDGNDLAAGAVGAVGTIANPIILARAVMAAGRHVLLVGEGARRFAEHVGIATCAPDALVTEARRARWAAARDAEADAGGTVGAVARDRGGHLAAATSTGGLPRKLRGRVGDSALIGCGTYADDRLGAASCTGNGEAIIRAVLAKTALEFLHTGDGPMTAAKRAVHVVTTRIGADAGIILVDPHGRIGYARNTAQMTCALIRDAESTLQVLD
jgi:beta-aspartyl-peptidase (threonine type)